MRKLPYLNSEDSSNVKGQYKSMMDKFEYDEFMARFPRLLKLLHDLDDAQIKEVMEKLTGFGIPAG